MVGGKFVGIRDPRTLFYIKQVITASIAFATALIHLPILLAVRRLNLHRAEMVPADSTSSLSATSRWFRDTINKLDPGVIMGSHPSLQSYRKGFELDRLARPNPRRRSDRASTSSSSQSPAPGSRTALNAAAADASNRLSMASLAPPPPKVTCNFDSLELRNPTVMEMVTRGHVRGIYVQWGLGFFMCLALLILVKFTPGLSFDWAINASCPTQVAQQVLSTYYSCANATAGTDLRNEEILGR
jgi:hypothetical protein